MSRRRDSFSADDFLDFGFTWARGRIKKYVKDHPNAVTDTTSFIARITIVSMVMAGCLDIVVEKNAVRCEYGRYYTTTLSFEMLVVVALLLLFQLLCKCLEKKNIPLPRLLALFCNTVGVVVLLFYSPKYTNYTCFEYGVENDWQPFTGHHPVASTMSKTPPARTKPWTVKKICVSYENHCALQFLRAELNTLVCCCAATWVITFFIFISYVIRIFGPQPETEPTQLLMTRYPAAGKTLHGVRQVTSPESVDPPSSLSPEPVTDESRIPSDPSAVPRPLIAKSGHLAELQSPVYSTTSSSTTTEGLIRKDQLKRIAKFDPVTEKCSVCGARTVPSTPSYSDETSSGDDPTKTFSPIVSRPLLRQVVIIKDNPKYCQNCGAQFLHQ